MTISSLTNRVSYSGDGSTTAFPITFTIFDEADLIVITRVKATGAETLLTLSTDYTVASDFSTVDTTTAVASTDEIHIIRDTKADQPVDFINGGASDAEVVERALDRIATRDQRFQDTFDRMLRVAETDSAIGPLAPAESRVDKIIQFNSSGDPTLKSPSDLSLSASAVLGWQSVKEEGALGDGATDDSGAFGTVQTTLDGASGGVGYVPFKSAGYLIGDGSTAGTGLELTDKTHWKGDAEVKLIHQAKNANGSNFLFTLEDVEDAKVENFEIDGGSGVRVGVTLAGTVDNVVLRDLHIHDCDNFALQYADSDTNTASAYLNNVLLENIRIDGVTGTTGGGSGINFFPRAGDAFSTGLVMSNVDVDVTEDSTTVGDHGPQACKLSNINNVQMSNCRLRGGKIAALVLTTGVREVQIDSLHTSRAAAGLWVDSEVSAAATAATPARRILVNNLVYRQDGVSGADHFGINIEGDPQGVEVRQFDIEGDIRFRANSIGDTLENVTFGAGIIRGGNMVVDDDGNTPSFDIRNFRAGSLSFLTPTNNTAVDFGETDWPISESSIGKLYIESFPLQGIAVWGDDNHFGEINANDGNTGGSAVGTAVRDIGDRNQYDLIRLTGASHDTKFFLRKLAGDGLTVKGVSGTPINTQGFDFQNQENSDVPTGDMLITAGPFDLSGSSASEQVYVADVDTYILGVRFLYWEASSADAGVDIRIRRDTTNMLVYTSETGQSRFASTNYINTSGTRSFASRKIAKGETLDVLSNGGKTGTGEVMVQISMVRARS